MRHIKAFENFFGQSPDLGRFSEEESQEQNNPLYSSEDSDEQDWLTSTASTEEQEEGEECEPCGQEGEEEEQPFTRKRTWGDEVIDGHNDPSTPSVEGPVYVESFAAFFEGKKKEEKGKTPKTEKEKELAKKYPPKDKITRGDFIAAAIENKKKGGKKEEDEDDKESDKKSEKGLSAAQKKLPAALQKAILAKKKK